MNTFQKSVVENLSDGITTPMSFLLPMVIAGGHLDGKALILGTIGGGVSMAYAFKSMEGTDGTWSEWLVSFVCSIVGGLVPILAFLCCGRAYGSLLTALFMILAIYYISKQKTENMSLRAAVEDTSKNIIPALIVVGVLSLM